MAVPSAVAESTVTAAAGGAVEGDGEGRVVVPESPSVTVTSSIERVGGVVVVDDRADALAVGDRGVGGRVR